MDELPIQYLVVEFEEVDGKRRIKKLEDGSDPITAYGHMLIEMDREHRQTNNGWPLVEVSVSRAKGAYGEADHYEMTVYSLETGTRVPVSRVVVVDKATGKPATIVSTADKNYIPKSSSVVQVEQMLSHEKLKEAATKRGLQLKSESVSQLTQIVSGLEG